MAARPLHEMVDAGWARELEPVTDRIHGMGDFLRAEIAAGRGYLPAGKQVLRAFRQPFADVRVLIVGQDPYPTPGHPVGLSFSIAPEVRRLPPSLANIFREYASDLGYPAPATGDLSPWTERGVMLLNRVLTVQPGKPGSHRGRGWEEVTGPGLPSAAPPLRPGSHPVGARCGQPRPAAAAGPVHPVAAPEPAFRRPRVLRLAPVQQGQRTARAARRAAGRLEAAVRHWRREQPRGRQRLCPAESGRPAADRGRRQLQLRQRRLR